MNGGHARKAPGVVPSGISTPAIAVPAFTVPLPGTAEDYSRVRVKAVVRDQGGREIGQGQAAFPEYRPIERKEVCQCYDAFVELHMKATTTRS